MASQFSITAMVEDSVFIPRLVKGLDPKVKAISIELGEAMAEEANKLISERFEYRPFARRRHPGSRRASTAMSYAVLGNQYPYDVVYRILGGRDVQKRVLILHYGRPAVTIRPSGAWPLKTGTKAILAWPEGEGIATPIAPFRDFSENRFKVYTKVTSKATQKGSGFLDEAQAVATRKVLRRAR
jgi:hypothetical protein